MEEQFITDDKESRLKYLREQMILLEEQCSEYESQLIPLMAHRTVVFWFLGEKWRVLDEEYEETKLKVLALEKEIVEQKAQESADISVDETLQFEEKEIELVTTEIDNAEVLANDVSMSTERQEFVSVGNETLFLDEESYWKEIARIELEEDDLDEIEYEEDLEVADSQESLTRQKMENIFTDRQELSCYSFEEKPTIQQINIIELEKIIINQDLKTADFIEAKITKDHYIQIDEGDVISANSIMFYGSVTNNSFIGK